jgi:hypothetical protein
MKMMIMMMLIDSDTILLTGYVFSSPFLYTARHASEHFPTSFLIDVLYLYER